MELLAELAGQGGFAGLAELYGAAEGAGALHTAGIILDLGRQQAVAVPDEADELDADFLRGAQMAIGVWVAGLRARTHALPRVRSMGRWLGAKRRDGGGETVLAR